MRAVACCLLLAGCGTVLAAAPQQELEQIRERIGAVEGRLKDVEAEYRDAERALAESEQALGRTGRELAALARERRRLAARQAELETRRAALGEQLREARQALAAALRTGYALARTPLLAVALNPDGPQRLGRALGYHRALIALQQERLAAVADAEQRLAAALAEAERTARQLAASGERLGAARRRLEAERAARADALRRLHALERRHGEELAGLRQREQALEALVRELAQAPAHGAAGLGEHRGRLPWPVQGRLRRPPPGSARRGVLIDAPAGAPVTAIAPGRVVFAHWMRGFGLLIIVDHGDGYLSLYGHNGTLLKAAGERVAAGEPIATVGDSGGQRRPALYLELRRGRKPVDPLAWLAPASDARG